MFGAKSILFGKGVENLRSFPVKGVKNLRSEYPVIPPRSAAIVRDFQLIIAPIRRAPSLARSKNDQKNRTILRVIRSMYDLMLGKDESGLRSLRSLASSRPCNPHFPCKLRVKHQQHRALRTRRVINAPPRP